MKKPTTFNTVALWTLSFVAATSAVRTENLLATGYPHYPTSESRQGTFAAGDHSAPLPYDGKHVLELGPECAAAGICRRGSTELASGSSASIEVSTRTVGSPEVGVSDPVKAPIGGDVEGTEPSEVGESRRNAGSKEGGDPGPSGTRRATDTARWRRTLWPGLGQAKGLQSTGIGTPGPPIPHANYHAAAAVPTTPPVGAPSAPGATDHGPGAPVGVSPSLKPSQAFPPPHCPGLSSQPQSGQANTPQLSSAQFPVATAGRSAAQGSAEGVEDPSQWLEGKFDAGTASRSMPALRSGGELNADGSLPSITRRCRGAPRTGIER